MLKHIKFVTVGTLSLGLLAGILTIPSYGQEQMRQFQPDQTEGDSVMAKLQDLQQQAQQIQTQLEQIAQAANEQTPELSNMRESLEALYQRKLEEHGFPSDAEMQELQQIQARLQTDEDMDADERQRLTQQFQEKVMELQRAQQAAQQDDEVQDALEKFHEARTEAMTKIDENTAALQQELENIHHEMQTLQQQMQPEPQPQPQPQR